MTSKQSAKAAARQSAEAAPKADPETAKQALRDAKKTKRPGESSKQFVYKTQEDIAGNNVHNPKDEF